MLRSKILLLALVASLIVGVGCSSAKRDEAIATDLKAKMFSDPQLKDSSLQVTVTKGEATLTGTVPSDAARYEAFKLATETPGVSKVNDQMTVETTQAVPAPPAPEPAPEPAPAPKRRAARRAMTAMNQEAPPQPAPAPVENPTPPPAAAPAPPPPPPPPQPVQVEIPAGTTISIRMIDGVDSSINHTGEQFHASLDAPIVVNDQVIVPKGADVYVRLVQASSAGHMTGKSELRLELIRMDFQGKSYPLVSSTYEQAGSSRGKRTAATVGGGAALGAIIGAIAGGGKGAAIGAGVGGAGGGVYQGVTKGQQVKIPSETKLDFRLEQPCTVTYMPKRQSYNQ
jgi:hypothetical protein